MMRNVKVFWVLSALAGCAGPQVQARSPGVVILQLITAAVGEADGQTIAPGAVLRSGDRFALQLDTSRAVSLYVGQRSAAGEVALIYPPAPGGPLRAAPGYVTHLPKAGEWFQLDQHAGQEVIYVLASTQQLQRSVALQQLRAQSDALLPVREPPPAVEHRDRGPEVRAVLPEGGSAVLRFPFLHH